MDEDPWGVGTEPATAGRDLEPLSPRLAELAALTSRRRVGPEEDFEFPEPGDLPEVAELVAEGWCPLPPDELMSTLLPAAWPARDRCWVVDRRPRVCTSFDGQGSWVGPWSAENHEEAREEVAAAVLAAGLPVPPPSRLWLLRSPWRSLGTEMVLYLIRIGCEERDEEVLAADRPEVVALDVARELLTLSEDEVWARLPESTAEVAYAWRGRGREGDEVAELILAGLGPQEVEALSGAGIGLSEAQAVRWCEAVQRSGPAAVERIRAWRELGLPPDPPRRQDLVLSETDPAEARRWFDAGFDLDDVEKLMGLSLDEAVDWRSHGFDVPEIADLLTADRTLTPAEASAFETERVGADERLAWIANGFAAAEARAWTDVGILPNEARVWRSVGKGPEQARAQLANGGEPIPDGMEVGWTAFGRDPVRAAINYGVVDPPGTRGSAAEAERFDFSRGRDWSEPDPDD